MHDLHIITVALDPWTVQADALQTLLSVEEQTRAASFRYDHLRKRFVVAHAALRAVLAKTVGVPADELVFTVGASGKPMLDPAVHTEPLHFNLTHTEGHAAIITSRTHPVGIDLEQQTRSIDAPALSERFFTQTEADTIAASTQPMQDFFYCWTLKEAILKATGLGLSGGLQSFSVDFENRQAWQAHTLPRGDSTQARHVFARAMPCDQTLSMAIALESTTPPDTTTPEAGMFSGF